MAPKTNPCFFEPVKWKSVCIPYGMPRQHSLFIVHRLVFNPPARCYNSPTENRANTALQWQIRHKAATLIIKNQQQLTHRPLAKEIPSAAQSVLWLLSLALERKLPGCRPGSTILTLKSVARDAERGTRRIKVKSQSHPDPAAQHRVAQPNPYASAAQHVD